MALEITDNNFKEILAEGKPVVIDFLGALVRTLQNGRPYYRRVGR